MRAVWAARVASLVKGNDWHRKNGGKHVSAAPVSFEKSSHPSPDTQRYIYPSNIPHRGDGVTTPPRHPPLSFSDLRRGTSASPLSPRTSRPRDQRAGARNARPPHSQACHLQRSGKRDRKACRRVQPAAPRHRMFTRLSHWGGRGRPWAEFPRRFPVWLRASCPGRRRPRSQYRRRFWRPQWQPRRRNRALSCHS